jgi:hypothetical protein
MESTDRRGLVKQLVMKKMLASHEKYPGKAPSMWLVVL